MEKMKNISSLSCFIVLAFLSSTGMSVGAEGYGNTNAQEYGDAVYDHYAPLGWDSRNYNHTGIYAGIDGSNYKRVIHAQLAINSVQHEYLQSEFLDEGSNYYGAYTPSNETLSFSQRKEIIQTARDLDAASIYYTAFNAIDWKGWSFDGSISDIDNIRCDGVVEYCYEKNGHKVWWDTGHYSQWNIATDAGVGYHNNMPGSTVDPDFELSPWAQRGAPPVTGPTFNQSDNPHNSFMIRPALIDLPTYEVSSYISGDHFVVTVKARDVKSGIHLIGYRLPGGSGWSYKKNVQHPSSDTYTQTFNVYSEGTFYYWAQDNGGNQPENAQSINLQFPPEIPAPPSLSSPSNGSTVNGTEINFQWNSSSGATNYHMQLATNSSFSNLLYDSDVGNTTSIQLSGFLDDGTRYYWHVKAGNSAGWSGYSGAWYFNNGTPPSDPRISGYVRTSSGSGISGVTVTFSNSGGTDTTDSDGYYSEVVPYGWSGTATPSKADYTFSPTSKSYSNVKSNDSSENYTGYPPVYTLYVNSSSATAVPVSSSTGHGGTTNYTRSGLVSGTSVTLTAPLTASGKTFTGWTGALTSSNRTISLSMTGNKTVTANYESSSYTLSVTSSGASGVPISSSTGHGGTTNYTKSVSSGSSVTLTAPLTASGKTFTGWTGAVTSSNRSISFSMNVSKTVSANYATSTHTLTTSVIGGNGTLSPASGSYGGVVELTAVPDPGYKVKAWSGTDNDSSKGNTNTVTMNSDKSVTVEFEIKEEGPDGWNLINFDLHNSNLYPYPSEVRIQDVPFTEQWTGVGTTMKTGDIDGDGALELVTSDGSVLYVYDGNGAIEWQMASAGSLNVLADVTGDGTPEILMSIKDGTTIRIEAYDGTGPALPAKTFSTSVHASYGNAIARGVSDLDGDGYMELIAFKGTAWYNGRGVVVFDCETTAQLWYYDIGPFVPYPAVGDVTGLLTDKEILHGSGGPSNGVTGADGSKDNACYAFLLDAVGSSLWRKQFEGSGFVNASTGLCDIDNDGRLDVIATSFSHGFNFWDGSFGRVYVLDPTSGVPIPGFERNFSVPVTLGGFADLDGDGTSEIIVDKKDGATQTGSIIALSPVSGLPTESSFSVSGGRLAVLFINDLNGDGKLEVVVNGIPADGSDHTLYVLDNGLNLLWSMSPGGGLSAIVSDLNQNGKNEIIMSSGGSIHILEGHEACSIREDLDGDCDVDMKDFAVAAANWLKTDCTVNNNWCGGADVDRSGTVDFADIKPVLENWLSGVSPDPEQSFSDDFSGDLSQWNIWYRSGYRAETIATDGNPAPCLLLEDYLNYGTYAASKQTFDYSGIDIEFSADMKVGDAAFADQRAANLMLVKGEAHSPSIASIGFSSNTHSPSPNLLWCYVTYEEAGEEMSEASGYISIANGGGWHNGRIRVRSDGIVEFYFDEQLVYTSTHTITPAYDGLATVEVGGRRSLYDNVVVK